MAQLWKYKTAARAAGLNSSGWSFFRVCPQSLREGVFWKCKCETLTY